MEENNDLVRDLTSFWFHTLWPWVAALLISFVVVTTSFAVMCQYGNPEEFLSVSGAKDYRAFAKAIGLPIKKHPKTIEMMYREQMQSGKTNRETNLPVAHR